MIQRKRFLISKRSYGIFFKGVAFLLLCTGTIRSQHEGVSVNVFFLLIMTCFIGLIPKFTVQKRNAVMSFLPFIIIVAIEILFRFCTYGLYYSGSNEFSALIVFLMMVLCVDILVNEKSSQSLWAIINTISIIASILVFVQWAGFIAGIRFDKIPVLSNYLFTAHQYAFFRPSSLFPEPSHFAEFVLISAFYYLFVGRNYKKFALVATGCILSTSSLGIVGVALLGVLHLLNIKYYSIKKWKKYVIILLAMIAAIGVIYWIGTTNNLVIQRTLSGSSYGVRVNRSFELFSRMNNYEKILGIGIQNQALYLNFHGIILNSDALETIQNREFAQTFGYLLCTTGLIGVATFGYSIWTAAKRGNYKIKSFILFFFYICFTCCVFSRSIFAIYLIALFLIDKTSIEET